MPTVFETLTDRFYIAFLESDSEKRRVAIETWIKEAVPVVQFEVENELRSYIGHVLEQTWTTTGWESRARKFSGTTQDLSQRRRRHKIPFIDGYRLRLDVSLGHPWGNRKGEPIQSIGPVSPESHSEALHIAQQTLSNLDHMEAAKLAKQSADVERAAKSSRQGHPASNSDDDDYDDTGNERTSNDDRSDSMNPNNDAYQASMDNRSDQMNPNNSAYWSSRGR